MASRQRFRHPRNQRSRRNMELPIGVCDNFSKKFLRQRLKFRKLSSVAWGRSSAGRALDWQSRGQGFDPPRLHHAFLDLAFAGSFFVSDDCTLKPGRIRSGQTRWMRALGEQDDMAIAACRERHHACTGPPCKDMRLRPETVLWITYMPNYAIRVRNSFLIA